MSSKYDADRIREQIAPYNLASYYRIIREAHESTPLGAAPNPSRFSDPAGQYSVVYAAESIRCAFWEAIARGQFTHKRRRTLDRADILSRRFVTIDSQSALDLVDLREDGCVRIGVPTEVVHGSNHAAGRALSGFVHANLPFADGFLFDSRHVGDICIAVFERAAPKLSAVSVDKLIADADFLDALVDYDITLENIHRGPVI